MRWSSCNQLLSKLREEVLARFDQQSKLAHGSYGSLEMKTMMSRRHFYGRRPERGAMKLIGLGRRPAGSMSLGDHLAAF